MQPILLPSTRKSLSPRLWFGIDVDAELTNSHIEISEYQLYAVEKWIVDRSRPIHVLLVYTGDPDHRITLTAFTPRSPEDYDKAIHHLRRDGARPKDTPHGVLMVTSLAHFRSDYTIVKIPNGDFLAVKDHLYANINLLRMGCSGRSALSLDEPSEPTMERFLSTYHLHIPSTNVKSLEQPPLPSAGAPSIKNPKKGKDRILFTATVLEFVKLIQAGLAIFAQYGSLTPPNPSLLLDGLLCDEAVDGIHRWIADIGEPCLGLEPTERVADPNFVSALLSMVLAIRNKLATLVASSASSSQIMPVPKDPFIHPYAFSLSLLSYLQNAGALASNSPIPPAFHTQMAPFVISGFAPPTQSNVSAASSLPISGVLSREVVEYIDGTYDKSKSSDNKRVRRVLKGKLDDLTRITTVDSDGDEYHSHSHFHSSASKDKRSAFSDSEAPHLHLLGNSPANSSIGSTGGNRVLGGISTLLLPGNTSLSTSPSGSGGAGSITEPIINLPTFLSVALSKEAGSSSFSSGKRGANLKRIRGSVGGGITAVSSAAPSDHGIRMGMTKSLGVGMAIGKNKKQRESVDMGSFYSGNGTSGGAGVVAGGPSDEGVASGPVERDEKEVVVGGSVKALWSGRVMEWVKMREWCDEVVQSGNSAHILPSSTHLSASRRKVTGSTTGSQHSTTKEKVKKLKGKANLSSGPLLSVHSDADFRSDAGRSTEGEESENIYPSASNTPLIHPETPITNPLASASFGSLLGGRVRGKLGNWANMTRRKGQSADFTASPPQLHLNIHDHSLSSSARTSPVVTRKSMGTTLSPDDRQDDDEGRRPSPHPRGISTPLIMPSLTKSNKRQTPGTPPGMNSHAPPMARRTTSNTSSGPQSPTLPPMVYPGDLAGGVVQSEDDFDPEEMLSSGQISPWSDHNRPGNPFITPRTLGHIPRNFSLALPQDHNFLSVSTINEKLAHLSDQRNADSSSRIPSARSSNTNLPDTNPRRKMFLYPTNSASNVGELTGDEDGRGEDSARVSRRGMRRPKLMHARTMSSATLPRISSWSDPLSARYILGGASPTPSLPELLYLGSRGENEIDEVDEGGYEEGEGGRAMAGGVDSEGDIVSDSLGSKPLPPRRPSFRTRRTEFARPRQGGTDTGGNNSSKERRDKEKTRFNSLLSIVDPDRNFFLEELPGSWDQPQPYSYDPDDIDGLYPYDWGMDEDDLGAGVDLEDEEWARRRRRRKSGKAWYDPLRRRSFEDLDDFYEMPVLHPERMRVDVEVCGQVLVMLRREEHLRNVVACLEILNGSLSSVNGLLRQEYESHLASLSQLTSRTKVLADLDLQSTRTDNLSQQTNVLRYEAEQFHVPSLYHTASLSRQKVLEMRHKVFGVHKVFDASDPALANTGLATDKSKYGKQKQKNGTGSGRVLPEGVRGAHGKFNRLQKRLDGEEAVVDYLGRTESEVEEEEKLGRHGLYSDAQTRVAFGRVDSEDEHDGIHQSDAGPGTLGNAARGGEGPEEVVEHSSIRPMWLLRFFMGWGARWSARASVTTRVQPGLSIACEPEKDGGGGEQEGQDEVRKVTDGRLIFDEENRKDR